MPEIFRSHLHAHTPPHTQSHRLVPTTPLSVARISTHPHTVDRNNFNVATVHFTIVPLRLLSQNVLQMITTSGSQQIDFNNVSIVWDENMLLIHTSVKIVEGDNLNAFYGKLPTVD